MKELEYPFDNGFIMKKKRSLKGQLFRCVSRSREEAERLCEDWLVGQDRCYIN